MATFTISVASVQSALSTALQSALAAEKQLGTQELTEINAVVQQVLPLIQAETQELITSGDPSVQESYLRGLVATVAATVAGCGLQAIAAERQVIISTIVTVIQALGVFVSAAAVVA